MTQTPNNYSSSGLDREHHTPVSGMPAQESTHNRDVSSNYDRSSYDEDDPRAIRRNIERTRAEMGETIDRIQDRLSPDRLRSQAEDAVREATIGRIENMAYDAKRKAKRAQRNVMQTVKENPIPAALIGVGFGWLLMSNKNNNDYDYDYDYDNNEDYYYSGYGRPYPANYRSYQDPYYGYESSERAGGMQPEAYAEYDQRYAGSPSQQRYAGSGWDEEGNRMEEWRQRGNEKVGNIREGAQHAAQRTQEEMDNMAQRVREGAGELSHEMQRRAEQMRYQMRRQRYQTKRQFNQAMDNNPLAVGALTLAAGALIGLMIPSTEMENEWMGEERERMMRQARRQVQSTAEKTMDKVQNVVEEATNAAKDAAKETTERTKAEAERQNLTSSSR